MPLRIKPFPDESLLGFALRLAERNAHKHVIGLLKRAGTGVHAPETILGGKHSVDGFATLAGVDVGTIRKMAYIQQADGRRNFNGHALGPDQFLSTQRRACPRCLAEQGYHKSLWDLSVVHACPVHGTKLISRCGQCGRRLGWRTAPLTKCKCGAEIRWPSTEQEDQENLLGPQTIAAIVGVGSWDIPEFLLQFDADDAIRLAVTLGWFIHFQKGRPRLLRLSTYHDACKLLTDGVRTCLEWPNSFHQYLDRLRQKSAARTGRFGAAKELGPLVEWVVKVAPSAVSSVLIPEMREYIGGLDAFTTRSRLLAPSEQPRYISVVQAGRILKRDPVKVGEVLLRHGVASAPYGIGTGAPMLVLRSFAHELGDELAQLVGRKHLPKALGCTNKDTEVIIRAGILPQAPPGIALDLFGFRAWRTRDIEAFVAQFVARAKGNSIADAVPLPSTFAAFRRGGMQVPQVLNSLLDGSLEVVGVDRSAVGLRKVLIGADDFPAPVRKPFPIGDTLSLEEVGTRLQIKPEVTCKLIKSGLLQTCTPGLRWGRRVLSSEVDAFEKKFVFAARIASEAGLHWRWAAPIMLRAGLRPVSGPSVDGARQYIFLRADVEEFIQAQADAR